MNNFDKNWRNAKHSIFRLQVRPEYKIPGEQEAIAKWKQGEIAAANTKEWRDWQKTLKTTIEKGIAIQRVRIIPEKLTDYIKFEIDTWREYSIKNGEELLFLDNDEFQKIITGCGFGPKDFWLFDNQYLLIFNYDKAGKFTGDVAITDGGMIKRYCELKSKLIEAAQPMESYLKKANLG